MNTITLISYNIHYPNSIPINACIYTIDDAGIVVKSEIISQSNIGGQEDIEFISFEINVGDNFDEKYDKLQRELANSGKKEIYFGELESANNFMSEIINACKKNLQKDCEK